MGADRRAGERHSFGPRAVAGVGEVEDHRRLVHRRDQLLAEKAEARVALLAATVGEEGGAGVGEAEEAKTQPRQDADPRELLADHAGALGAGDHREPAGRQRRLDLRRVTGEREHGTGFDLGEPLVDRARGLVPRALQREGHVADVDAGLQAARGIGLVEHVEEPEAVEHRRGLGERPAPSRAASVATGSVLGHGPLRDDLRSASRLRAPAIPSSASNAASCAAAGRARDAQSTNLAWSAFAAERPGAGGPLARGPSSRAHRRPQAAR